MTVVTKQRVFEAAAHIRRDGQNPTQARVAAMIGGSYSTIGPWLREWRQAEAGTPALGAAPERLRSSIEASALQIWRSIEDEFNERQRSALSLASEKEVAAKADYDEAIAEVKRLENEIDAIRKELSTVNEAHRQRLAKTARLGAGNAKFQSKKGEKKSR